MKTISTLLFAVLILTAFKFKFESKPTAIPEKVYGVDVYNYSMPTVEYTVLDSSNLAFATNCKEWINKPAKIAAKANADGVIITFKKGVQYQIRDAPLVDIVIDLIKDPQLKEKWRTE